MGMKQCSAILLLALLLGVAGVMAGETFGDLPMPAQCWPEGVIDRSDFPYCRLLDENLALHWNVARQGVTFGAFVSGKVNFVGLGITNGGLNGADLWVARADDAQPWLANPWHADDYFSVNASTGPVMDAQQDITLAYVEQTQTYTYITLERAMDTCDRSQDLKIYNDTDQMLLFAYGQAYAPDMWQQSADNGVQVRLNPTNFNSSNVTNSTASYYLEMYTEDPADLQAIPLTTNRFPVPSNQSNVYRCVDLDIGTYLDTGDNNPLDHKFHVIRYAAVVDSPLFHHATLYACTQPHARGSRRYTCAGQPPPYCAAHYALATPSAGNVSLPKEAGLPLGATSYRYFTLIVHYSNPRPGPLLPGARPVSDSSGLVLYLTQASLRPNDAAVLKLGTYTTIPAGTPSGSMLSTRSVCPAACTTSQVANASLPLKMFAAFFRLPASGSSIRVRHVRTQPEGNVSEIQPVAVRSYWNSSFQWSMTVLPQSRLLAPGDSLVTECGLAYMPSDAAFGLRDYCQALVMYFPATNFTDCGTYDGPAGQPATMQACSSADVIAGATAESLSGLLQTGSVLQDMSGSWYLPNASLYMEPCQQYIPPVVIAQTGAAVGGIVGVTVALMCFAYFLWARYGRHDEPETQQLIDEMRARMRSGLLEDEQEQQRFMGGPDRG